MRTRPNPEKVDGFSLKNTLRKGCFFIIQTASTYRKGILEGKLWTGLYFIEICR